MMPRPRSALRGTCGASIAGPLLRGRVRGLRSVFQLPFGGLLRPGLASAGRVVRRSARRRRPFRDTRRGPRNSVRGRDRRRRRLGHRRVSGPLAPLEPGVFGRRGGVRRPCPWRGVPATSRPARPPRGVACRLARRRRRRIHTQQAGRPRAGTFEPWSEVFEFSRLLEAPDPQTRGIVAGRVLTEVEEEIVEVHGALDVALAEEGVAGGQ